MLTATNNNKQGSSEKYIPLRKKGKGKKSAGQGTEFSYLSRTDSRMQFTNAQDPIYFAFEYLERKSVPELMTEFVKDSFFEVVNFVSKVVK